MYRMHQNEDPGSYRLNANNFSVQAVAVYAWVKTATLRVTDSQFSRDRPRKKMQELQFSVVFCDTEQR